MIQSQRDPQLKLVLPHKVQSHRCGSTALKNIPTLYRSFQSAIHILKDNFKIFVQHLFITL